MVHIWDFYHAEMGLDWDLLDSPGRKDIIEINLTVTLWLYNHLSMLTNLLLCFWCYQELAYSHTVLNHQFLYVVPDQ